MLKDLLILEQFKLNKDLGNKDYRFLDGNDIVSFLNKMIRKYNLDLKPVTSDNNSYLDNVLGIVYDNLYHNILNHKAVEFTREDYLEDYARLREFDKLHCLNVLNLVEGASEYVSFFNGLCMKYRLDVPFVHRVSRIYEDYNGDSLIYIVIEFLKGKILS